MVITLALLTLGTNVVTYLTATREAKSAAAEAAPGNFSVSYDVGVKPVLDQMSTQMAAMQGQLGELRFRVNELSQHHQAAPLPPAPAPARAIAVPPAAQVKSLIEKRRAEMGQ
jgi:hypothetical protein